MAISRDDFAQSVKTKYPQYRKIDNDELTETILRRYPQYRTQVEDKGAFTKLTDFVFSNTKKFGKTLGTAASVVSGAGATRQKTVDQMQSTIEGYFQRAKQLKETGDEERAEKYLRAAYELGQTEDIDIFQNPEYQKTWKEVAGEGLGTLLEVGAFASLPGFGAGSKAVTGGQKIAQGAIRGAKTGALFGGGFGVSGALQDDKSFGQIAGEGLKGAAIGGAAGGAIGGAIAGVGVGYQAAKQKAKQLIPLLKRKVGGATYNELIRTSREISKMSPAQSQAEVKWNKNTPKFLVDEGALTLIESDGKRLNTQNAVEALKAQLSIEDDAYKNLLKQHGDYISLNELKKRALEGATKQFKSRGSQLPAARRKIIKEIAEFKVSYADVGIKKGKDLLIPASDLSAIKSGFWARTSNFNPTMKDKLLSDNNYMMGHTAKELLYDKIDDKAIREIGLRSGDFISAIKVLEKAQGKTVPGGVIGKNFTKVIGGIAGGGSGPTGVVIGALTGGKLADIASNPQIKTKALTAILNGVKGNAAKTKIVNSAVEKLIEKGSNKAADNLIAVAQGMGLNILKSAINK